MQIRHGTEFGYCHCPKRALWKYSFKQKEPPMKTKRSSLLARLFGENTAHGFTIIETMGAMTLAGVLSTMALSGFSGFAAKERVNRAAAEMVTDLISAKTNAVRENRSFMISMTGNQSYTVFRDIDDNGAFAGNELQETKNLASRFADVMVSGATNVTISSRGTATPAVLTFSNGTYKKTVSLSATGRIRVSQ
jgi:Tfp pilus assembly protein FimT